jgi:hypothetical protein
MLSIYRVKTMFHLLQALILISKGKGLGENHLYIEDDYLALLTHTIQESNFFTKVTVLNKNKTISTIFRFKELLSSVVMFYSKKKGDDSEHVFYTPIHNMPVELSLLYRTAKKVIIFEEGNYSYSKLIGGKNNSFYLNSRKKSFLKSFFNEFFLTYDRCKSDRYIFTDIVKLSLSLPEEYLVMRERIIYLNLEKEISELSIIKKNNLANVFFNDFSLNSIDKKCIVLTQPFVESKELELDFYLGILEKELNNVGSDFQIYLKEHPRELSNKYTKLIEKFEIQVIDKCFPFELIQLLDINFELGITYNSTAINSKVINHRIILEKSTKE